MTRESLGQVRIYRYTCDQCASTTEHRIRGSRQVTLPGGWSRIRLQLDSETTGSNAEAEVCSSACARAWIDDQLVPAAVDESEPAS